VGTSNKSEILLGSNRGNVQKWWIRIW
jgi:hypothetical protein